MVIFVNKKWTKFDCKFTFFGEKYAEKYDSVRTRTQIIVRQFT